MDLLQQHDGLIPALGPERGQCSVVEGLQLPRADRVLGGPADGPGLALGEELGEVEVLVDGQSVGSSPLVAQEGYEEASLWNRAWYAIEGLAERAWAWLLG